MEFTNAQNFSCENKRKVKVLVGMALKMFQKRYHSTCFYRRHCHRVKYFLVVHFKEFSTPNDLCLCYGPRHIIYRCLLKAQKTDNEISDFLKYSEFYLIIVFILKLSVKVKRFWCAFKPQRSVCGSVMQFRLRCSELWL